MKLPSLRETAAQVRAEVNAARAEGAGSPRKVARALAARLAEVAVNHIFPTNGSGNNMSRG